MDKRKWNEIVTIGGYQFTALQLEVLRLNAKGFSNSDIAKILGCSQSYVEKILSRYHSKSALKIIKVKNRLEAVFVN